jgi:hypothetical protein
MSQPTPTGSRPGRVALDLRAVVDALRTGDRERIQAAIVGLGPVLRDLYDQGETMWQAGAPADFLAATLLASSRYHLRLHAHAVGATDSDLHTHKGAVYSTVLSGALTNTTATPTIRPDGQGLDVWQCACLADGTPTQARVSGLTAVVDPDTTTTTPLRAGQGFTVASGDYHRLAISPDPAEPTVTLCLFERFDPDAPDAFVLTDRSTPVLARRDMTAAAARAALRRLLDTAIA